MRLADFVRPSYIDIGEYVSEAFNRWGWEKELPSDVAHAWLGPTGIQLEAPLPEDHYVALLDPNATLLKKAAEVLYAWPEMYMCALALLNVIESATSGDMILPASGGVCGPGDKGFGHILVKSNNPVGYAEGVVHELGHHKLRALRIDMEEHDNRILANAPSELYESGVRKDTLRPMSAVLHAHYSYLHVTELELRAGDIGYDISQMAPYQQRRLSEGRTVIAAHSKWADAEAEEFGNEILAWTDELLTRLEAIL